MATVPLRFSNRLGFPMLEVQSVTEAGTVTTLNFNDHPQRTAYFYGGFWVKIPVLSAGTTGTNTVEFATLGQSGSNIPLYYYGGDKVPKSGLITTTGGVILCFYDRTSNRLQIIT